MLWVTSSFVLAFSQVLCWSKIPQPKGQYEQVLIFFAHPS
jgi:hypothetical protein